MEQTQEPDINLIEVYSRAAWPVLARQCLKKKRLLESRRARYGLTGRLGITFAQRYSIKMLLTHDQFYAAVAACLAYLFNSRKTCDYGGKLFEDTNLGILREGLIVQPVKSS
ncbi:hypothetical protein ES703_83254 [subsurface metagenome]